MAGVRLVIQFTADSASLADEAIARSVERYSATDTIHRQNRLYLTTGSKLYSNLGNVMLTIVGGAVKWRRE